jgi:pyridoxal phosphate enzyme (YggS family)
VVQIETYRALLRECERYGAKLLAVSKDQPVQLIRELYDSGHRGFGENRVQELSWKVPQLPEDIDWHLIGHLQTNKVKHVVPLVSTIQSIDSMRLLTEVDKRALAAGKVIDCLLQVHIAHEETKFGFSEGELLEMIEKDGVGALAGVRVVGLMGIASLTEDEARVRTEFRGLRTLFEVVRRQHFQHAEHFSVLSMGMSHDYLIALEEGSTMIRVGSLIFGRRGNVRM